VKILFLLTQDLESPSGLGRYWPLARELVRLGHTVTIAALHSGYRSLPYKRFSRDGVNIWYVAPMHVRKRGHIKSYYSSPALLWVLLRSTFALSWAALTVPADIIHIGKPHPMNALAGLLAKALLRRRVWLDCDDSEADVNRFGSSLQRWVMTFFEKWVPRRVYAVTTHTDFMSSRLKAWGVPPERIFYLSNGVDRQRFASLDEQELANLRQSLKLEGKRVVTYIGSLSLVGHPVDLLLKAFAVVQKKKPESILLLVGGGEDYERLRAQAQSLGVGDSSFFVGRVLPEQVGFYYRLSDVTVDPVHDDNAARARSPLKLFESWACGVPFVSADVGDRCVLIGDPPAGILAKPGDPASLAESILQILNDQKLARSLRTCGLERVKGYYWDRLALQLDVIYRKQGCF
jgi:glycosyltransferase involved in cell wall biosynthesis